MQFHTKTVKRLESTFSTCDRATSNHLTGNILLFPVAYVSVHSLCTPLDYSFTAHLTEYRSKKEEAGYHQQDKYYFIRQNGRERERERSACRNERTAGIIKLENV